MKKLLLTLSFLAVVIVAQAQSKSVASLKDKYKADDDFFHLELGGSFMNFAEGFKIDIDEDDLATVAKSVKLPPNSRWKKSSSALYLSLREATLLLWAWATMTTARNESVKRSFFICL